VVEQFWGRAVRASHDSKELRGAFYLCKYLVPANVVVQSFTLHSGCLQLNLLLWFAC
jgi:hypothetical protein